MKRKQAVDIILNILDNYHPINLSEHEKYAELILEQLEEVGMLPPNMALENGEFNQKKFNAIVSGGINCNQWEPE
jgi:hypothetical protein